MIITDNRAQSIVKALSNKSIVNLNTEFSLVWDERSTDKVVDSIFSKDDRGRSRKVVRDAVVYGAFGEACIGQLLTQSGFTVKFGSDNDYGFDLLLEFPDSIVKIEIKKQYFWNDFVVFNHPRKYTNLELSAWNNQFDLLVCWKLLNGSIVPWSITSNEAFRTSAWARCKLPTLDYSDENDPKPLKDDSGNHIYGKYIQDGKSQNNDHFRWLK